MAVCGFPGRESAPTWLWASGDGGIWLSVADRSPQRVLTCGALVRDMQWVTPESIAVLLESRRLELVDAARWRVRAAIAGPCSFVAVAASGTIAAGGLEGGWHVGREPELKVHLPNHAPIRAASFIDTTETAVAVDAEGGVWRLDASAPDAARSILEPFAADVAAHVVDDPWRNRSIVARAVGRAPYGYAEVELTALTRDGATQLRRRVQMASPRALAAAATRVMIYERRGLVDLDGDALLVAASGYPLDALAAVETDGRTLVGGRRTDDSWVQLEVP